MLKAFNMNLYCLKKMKVGKVLLIVLLSMVLFLFTMDKLIDVFTEKTDKEVTVNAGEFVEITGEPVEETETICSHYMEDIQSGMILLFISIFAVIFAHKDDKSGYIKNVMPQLKRKGDLILARIGTVAVYIFITFVSYFIVNLVVQKLYYPELQIGFSVEMLGVLGVQFLLYLAFASFCDFLTTLTRSLAFAITIGVLFANGFHMLFVTILNKLEDVIFGELIFDFSNMLTIQHMANVGIGCSNKTLLIGLLVAGIYLVVWNAASYVITSKRDVV